MTTTYTPQPGDILTKNGFKVTIFAVEQQKIYFELQYLDQYKGRWFRWRQEVLDEVAREQPRIERGEVQP